MAAPAPGPIDCDALVIGAGPAGLWLVFQLGLQGIAAQVVDALPHPGGQCSELYPGKPIYDIPGLPVCSGRELAERLLSQCAPFAPVMHLGQEVSALDAAPDGRWQLATSTGRRFLARSVCIAAGVGAFTPRALQVEGTAALAPDQLLYRLDDVASLAGRQVLVVGGEDGAVAAATRLAGLPAAQRPRSVQLLHRRAQLAAEPDLLQAFEAARHAGALQFTAGQIIGLHTDGAAPARLQGVQVVGPEGSTQQLPTDTLLVQLGISPRLGPISHWGLAMERRQLQVDTARFETSLPGVHAVGDIVHYPGKKKLIVCGFHEATLAAFAIAARLRPEAPQTLQYTTTSSLLQQRLGVRPQVPAQPG